MEKDSATRNRLSKLKLTQHTSPMEHPPLRLTRMLKIAIHKTKGVADAQLPSYRAHAN